MSVQVIIVVAAYSDRLIQMVVRVAGSLNECTMESSMKNSYLPLSMSCLNGYIKYVHVRKGRHL